MSRPTKHGNKWRIRPTGPDGTRRSLTFAKKADAERALRELERQTERVRAGLEAPIETNRTFSELADYWMKTRATEKRSAKDDESILRCHLRPAFGCLRLAELKVERVEAFKAQFPAGQKTLHNVLTLLIAMLNYAVELEWLAKVPRIKKPRIVVADSDFRYLRTSGEIERFPRAAFERDAGLGTLYATAVFTGMRLGELAGLRWADIDLKRRLIRVGRSFGGPTKGGYDRMVPILDPLLPHLKRWALRNPGPIVFPNRKGNMYQPSARAFQEIFRAVLKEAGLSHRGLTFHSLRHTFASHWMMNGGDLFKLQKIAGGLSPWCRDTRICHRARSRRIGGAWVGPEISTSIAAPCTDCLWRA